MRLFAFVIAILPWSLNDGSNSASVQGQDQPIVQQGHTGGITSVAYSPEGSHILTGSFDRTAILWDAKKGDALRTYIGHTQSVNSVAFSPDGSRILTSSTDLSAILWDKVTGEKLQILEGYGGVAFSPDGRVIVTTTLNNSGKVWDSSALVWDAGTGRNLLKLGESKEQVEAVAFSPDSRSILTASFKKMNLWNAETGERIHDFGDKDGADKAVFTPNGQSILAIRPGVGAVLLNATTGADQRVLVAPLPDIVSLLIPLPRFVPCSVAISGSGKVAAIGSTGGEVRLTDLTTGRNLRTIKAHKEMLFGLAFSPDGNHLATGARDGHAAVWDVKTGKREVAFEGTSLADVRSIALSQDEKLLIAGYRDAKAIIWNMADGIPQGAINTRQRFLNSVALSPDGKLAFTATVDGATLWDVSTLTPHRTFKGNAESTSLSPDGKTVVTFLWSDKMALWDAETGERRHVVKLRDGSDHYLAFSPDSSRLLRSGYEGIVSVLDIASGHQLSQLAENLGRASSVSVSPDGQRMLVGFDDGRIIIWDTQGAEKLRVTAGRQDAVSAGTFSPDSKNFVTASEGECMILWDAATGDKLKTFSGPLVSSLRTAVFTRGGRLIITGGDKGIVFWDAATAQPLCVVQALSEEDWVATTPTGFYDGSLKGIRRVSYREGNGLKLIPAEKADPALRQPGLVARTLQGSRP